MYTDQTEFVGSSLISKQIRILTVKTNTGSVDLESKVGDDWVVVNAFDTDGGWPIHQGYATYRITPHNGAVFEYV